MTLYKTHGGPDSLGPITDDFSTNANGAGPCPITLEALINTTHTAYPDPNYTALKELLAQWHQVPVQRIVLAASASEFIYRMSAHIAKQANNQVSIRPQVYLPRYSYSDYKNAAEAWSLATVTTSQDANLIWVCDPSTPFGETSRSIGALIDSLKAQQICVLDRAYDPLRLSGESALNQTQLDQVWQLWSPNKALGLTGIRAAYAIAPKAAIALIAELELLAPSWPLGVDGVSLLSSWAKYETHMWLQESLNSLREWKVQQLQRCQAMGWEIYPSETNFYCAKPPVNDLCHLLFQLRQSGIKLRDTLSFGLADCVRIAVLPPASQIRLCQAWQSISPPTEKLYAR
ncbi:aminotransferase class I/II-fold pyridoxal phosphate-dependent enzyme [Polynucleobacter sp. IMCC30063]|uniref:aminotransferase class I/II-fold pyridoxal phosphate-dependent enzyme n=1 Tax=Polynucleobacter sp. IMCC30063 TaxID=2907298 RepID=UPI001F3341E4|nr:aminotransferase class I/II-fold pyridoxal phosphate-dependent enzyme [Polynucleobacter sp. IMCC30063]MCE7506775.1 aminotransferase class I/II-fold pyridoxal phosphate-dependent enzyme [Polynucleobacter sp. IMCC30063]